MIFTAFLILGISILGLYITLLLNSEEVKKATKDTPIKNVLLGRVFQNHNCNYGFEIDKRTGKVKPTGNFKISNLK